MNQPLSFCDVVSEAFECSFLSRPIDKQTHVVELTLTELYKPFNERFHLFDLINGLCSSTDDILGAGWGGAGWSSSLSL